MATIDQFLDDPVSLDELQGDYKEPVKVSNKASNLNLAAHVAVMSDKPEEAELLYRTASTDLESGGSADLIVQMAKEKNFSKAKGAMIEYLSDPQYSDEEKSELANAVLDATNQVYNVNNTLSAESLEADNSIENNEQEYVRVSLSSGINELNQIKAETQALVNVEAAKSNSDLAAGYADIVEYMLPFVETKFSADVVDAMRNGEGWAIDEAFVALGSLKMNAKELISSIPPSERMDFTRKIIDIINVSDNITLVNENDFAKVDMMRTLLEDGYYEDVDKWIDNAASILNLVGIGAALKKPLKHLFGSVKTRTSIARDVVRSRVQPTSVSQNYKDTNPSKAKGAHEIVATDESGEAAEALYGTTRTDAIANDLNPEIGNSENIVTAKVDKPDAIYLNAKGPDPDLMEYVDRGSSVVFDRAEKVQMRARAVNDFEQVDGMRARKEMFQYTDTDTGILIRGVYGPPKSGYSNPQEALDMAEWMFRDYGLTADNFKLLVRQGGDYVPTSVQEIEAMKVISETAQKIAKPKGRKTGKNIKSAAKAGLFRKRQPDYLVQVDYDYKYNPLDITKMAEVDVKYNIFDRLPIFSGTSGAGSLQSHLLDPASMFNPLLISAANASFDQAAGLEKKLLKQAGDVAESIKRLEPERQDVLQQIIREANDKGIEFNYTDRVAQGITPAESKILSDWKEYWDTIYTLENRDLAKTLNTQGYKVFIDEVTDTRLIAKPVAKGGSPSIVRYYDQETDTIKSLSKVEKDMLYDKSGTVAKLRRPIQVGEEQVEYIVSFESPRAYLKGITPSTQVLNYRKGYFPVKYTDPWFIDEVFRDPKTGAISTKAVATAGNVKDAKLKASRLTSVQGKEYIYRRDVKNLPNDSDTHWDLQQASGRTSQRIRGKRLEDSTSHSEDLSQAPILGPVDTMIMSARSISNRASLRDVVETTKLRFHNQFNEYMPTGDYGQKVWPSNVKDIKRQPGVQENPKKLADARTLYNYINYLENGYINSLDNGYKAMLRTIADIAGNSGLSKIESGANWLSNSRGPSAMGKNLAFNLYLAANPARQFIVQSHQMVQLAANFPMWFVSHNAVPEILLMTQMQLGMKPSKTILKSLGMDEVDAGRMFKGWQDSGLAASIDKQNLVRGALADLADEVSGFKGIRKIKQAKTLATAPLKWSRKLGFDAGENMNMLTAWLAHRDAAKRAGKDVYSQDVLDEIRAGARNYTYNMNAAGDLPYNQNALAAIFQFMQVPHKAITTMTFNRQLTAKQKARLVAFNGVMYSLPPATMYAVFGSILPENPEARDAVVQGLEGYMFNKTLSLMSGTDTRIDWSGLSPLDLYGTAEFLHGLVTTDVGTIIAGTPSGQLFFGGNPRLTNLAKSAARFTNVIDDHEDPTTFGMVAMDAARMFSGMSNLFKASYADKYRHKINSVGGITDPEVTRPEALAQVFGFGTMDEASTYYINNKRYIDSKQLYDDVDAWYKEMKRHLLKKGITQREFDYTQKVMSEAWRVFGNDNVKAKDRVSDLISRDAADGDYRLIEQVMKMQGISSQSDLKTMIDAVPDMNDDLKRQAKEAVDFIHNYRNED